MQISISQRGKVVLYIYPKWRKKPGKKSILRKIVLVTTNNQPKSAVVQSPVPEIPNINVCDVDG